MMKSITFILIFISLMFGSNNLIGNPALQHWLPTQFDQELLTIDKTPYELLNTTNANGVFGVDYLLNDELFVEVLAIKTRFERYDKCINQIHRSKGNILNELEIITIQERDFIISTYFKANSNTEYIVSFDLEQNNFDEIKLHSNWCYEEFQTVNALYHYELRFSDKENIAYFLEAMIQKIEDSVELVFDPSGFICPKTFVKTFEHLPKKIALTIYNEQDEFLGLISNDVENYEFSIEKKLDKIYFVPIQITEKTEFKLEGIDQDLDIFLVEYELISSSLNIDTGINIKTYPNPASDYLMIDIDQPMTLQINDSKGNFLIRKSLEIGNNRIHLSSFPKGSYFIRCKSDKQYLTKKVIVI